MIPNTYGIYVGGIYLPDELGRIHFLSIISITICISDMGNNTGNNEAGKGLISGSHTTLHSAQEVRLKQTERWEQNDASQIPRLEIYKV